MDPLHPIIPTQPTIPPVVPPPPVRRVDRDAREGRGRDASGRRREQAPSDEDALAPDAPRPDDGDEHPHIDITV
jgi:hypothetical protein